ncbi:MAG: hypothetical protein KAY22_05700 [Rhizorhabdus sp.]|uniref:hypothetical protein n=1 Tax=Rhizorhabdus sp. TaxID=1968843 RepID=UPI001B549FC8|nr:hypothetical protein [Rhizorhabdus sp.]MBP8231780.1 hypothetical protein [Rhizorhabdus sp.]
MDKIIIGGLKSKTVWVAALIAFLSVVSAPVQEWIATAPALAGSLVAAIMVALRALTDGSLADKLRDAA